MSILEVIGGLSVVLIVGIAVGHAFGVVKFSAEISKDDGEGRAD